MYPTISATLPTVEQLPLPHCVKIMIAPKWKAAAREAGSLYGVYPSRGWHSTVTDELNTGKLWRLVKHVMK